MYLFTLLADPRTIRLEKIAPANHSITLVVVTVQPGSCCPSCHHISKRIHSRYQRQITDLPCQGIPVRLMLYARRFRCQNSLCTRRIFCERLPRVVATYARQTIRVITALELIGFAIGGEAGARLARELGLKISPDTLLRRLRRFSHTKLQPKVRLRNLVSR
jgi:hypothetical protein